MVTDTIQKTIPRKGTRLKWLFALTLLSTIAWVYSFFGNAAEGQAVTFIMWADFEKWLFLAYGASESADKYSTAVLNKDA